MPEVCSRGVWETSQILRSRHALPSPLLYLEEIIQLKKLTDKNNNNNTDNKHLQTINSFRRQVRFSSDYTPTFYSGVAFPYSIQVFSYLTEPNWCLRGLPLPLIPSTITLFGNRALFIRWTSSSSTKFTSKFWRILSSALHTKAQQPLFSLPF